MKTTYAPNAPRLRGGLLAGLTAVGLALLAAVTPSYAGPFILAGTDADDHGFNSGGNQEGWLFMQKALSNIAPGVTNGNTKVYILGSTSTAATAANSAFAGAGLAGWTVETVTTANFANFFGNVGGQQISSAGILMMDSGFNVGGGVDGSAFSPYSATINSFLGGGGGLFSQANGYAWLGSLVPGLVVVGNGSQGLALTAAGNAAFPGLTNSDLSSGPWHNYFTNTGLLPVLAVDSSGAFPGAAVIIGASGGTITNPNPPGNVPDGGSFASVYLGLAGLLVAFRRRAVNRSAA